MKVDFRSLPSVGESTPRPVVDVFVEGLPRTGLGCLVDSGSLHNRFGKWVADMAGIDLEGLPFESLGVGGRSVIARTATVGLRVGETRWEAPVSFCEPWPWDFHLAGQEGFLRWFRVVIDAAERRLELIPHDDSEKEGRP